MTDPLHPQTAAEAAEAFMRNVPTDDPKMPEPRIDSVRFFTGKVRKQPKAGDRRVTKAHGLQIRVHIRARDTRGNPMGMVCSNGRPLFDWCKPQHLAPWDRHYLSPDELAEYFPPEREPGYMQMRGAT